jgi:hypothetical protein
MTTIDASLYVSPQAAINASSVGDDIWFPAAATLSATLSLKPGRSYRGALRTGTIFTMANGANLDALAASEVWLSAAGSPTSDTPITVSGIGFNGNKANQSSGAGHGLVLMNYYSNLDNVDIYDTRGDGLRWTTTTLAGHTVTNTMVENHLRNVSVTNPGGYGIHVEDSSYTKLTDGWLEDCAVNMESSGKDGIFVDSAAGWRITGNHVYGCLRTPINVNRSAWTRVTGNYVEAYGSSNAETQYAGIALGENRNTWVSTANNTGADNIGISVYAASSGTGEVLIVGNGLAGVSGRTYGIYVANQSSSATLRVHLAGNQVRGWSTPYGGSAASGTLEITGPDAFPLALSTSATVGFHRMPTCAGTPTGTPADTTAGLAMVYDTTGHKLFFYEGGAWHYIARTA